MRRLGTGKADFSRYTGTAMSTSLDVVRFNLVTLVIFVSVVVRRPHSEIELTTIAGATQCINKGFGILSCCLGQQRHNFAAAFATTDDVFQG
jgi:hypothetical protein